MTLARTELDESAAETVEVKKYLTFKLGTEVYGVEVMKVREILQMAPITRMPHAVNSVKGVINLRGRIIPVMCLRGRFGMDEVPETRMTCIIIVEIRHDGNPLKMGLIVDEVLDVQDISSQSDDQVQGISLPLESVYVCAVSNTGSEVVILLDTERVLTHEEQQQLSDLTEAAQGKAGADPDAKEQAG
ncbi:MAG: chemotaxis protein CheW [Verrucomicrobiota bacterium]